MRWIESVVPDLERRETIDLTDEIGQLILRFEGKNDSLSLETIGDTGWFELTVRPLELDSVFAEWDDIQLGERLVDDLGGITLVDCGGVYAPVFSPYNVRISRDRMELVELPEAVGDPFDEDQTKLIRRR
jgi:hypothetical protein